MIAATAARGLVLALVQALLLAGVGAKLLADRVRLPRVWAEAPAFDPELPIRGRYASLALAVRPADDRSATLNGSFRARLEVRDGQLVAIPDAGGPVQVRARGGRGAPARWALAEPVLYFLPEHAADPSRRAAGEALWAEVTVPEDGPPRPIRLGVRREAAIEPLPD